MKKNLLLIPFKILMLLCFVVPIFTHAEIGKWYYMNTFVSDGKIYFGPYENQDSCIKAAELAKTGSLNFMCYQDTGNIPVSKIHFQGTPNEGTTGVATPTPPQKNATYTVTPKTKSNLTKDTYTLLAPIGDLKCIENGEGTSNPNCAKGNVGTYINIFFKIAIGLAGALAVIMIVIHSVSYMGDESVFGKTEAKSSILSAIGGLLLALGAWALLNTIDPALTGSRGIQIDEMVVELDEEPIIKDDPNITIQKGAIAGCPEGISKISTKGGILYACNSIAPKFKDMVNKAWAEGIQISGGGFRTRAKQEALRAKNCGGSMNIYNKKAVCNPQTALPGTSMHESGLAFDLACEGKLINTGTGKKNRFQVNTSTRKCFDWLNKNAGSFGLKNLKAENWHWSTTGK